LIRAEEKGTERKGREEKLNKKKKGKQKRNAQKMKGNEEGNTVQQPALWQKEATGQQANP